MPRKSCIDRKYRNAIGVELVIVWDRIFSLSSKHVDDGLDIDAFGFEIRKRRNVNQRRQGWLVFWHMIVTVVDWPEEIIVILGIEGC